MSADVRPAYPDNEPRIEERGDRIFVNGLLSARLSARPVFRGGARRTLGIREGGSARMRLVVNGEPQDVPAATARRGFAVARSFADAKVATRA